MSSKESCRSELRIAIRQLSDRCLYSSYKWAAEQLIGIEQDPSKFTPSNTRFQRGSSSIRRKYRTHDITATPIAGVSYVATPVMEEDELVDGDFYLLAKSYFDCREYKRAAHVLRDQIGRKSLFLRFYALYLSRIAQRSGRPQNYYTFNTNEHIIAENEPNYSNPLNGKSSCECGHNGYYLTLGCYGAYGGGHPASHDAMPCEQCYLPLSTT
ncbi:anaphase-promoting complex subunit 8-like protein [Trifolium pratense]|uniref:Anaphase-promoting complex subunit 8-like protein n=1 Tax=Trifolium pratense TaxID=57577 RepID=A0A2K3LC32_TRIPR|nr:anaphase-promoting complex subunit 8-like protein [Trifolium pratense]